MVRDTLGKTRIKTSELIRVFGALSKVSQKKADKKSQYVASRPSKKA